MQDNGLLAQILTFLAAAVVIVSLAPRLRISPVVGYLAAGVLLGPHLLRAVSDPEEVEIFAELGVVFLLFTIGLELSWDRLKAMRGLVFGLGTLQVVVTMAVITGGALLVGLPAPTAVILGGGFALSSTAVVTQILQSRGELASRYGRVVLGILLLQDLAIIPLLALAHALGGSNEEVLIDVAASFGKAIAATAVMLLLGRFLLRPLFRHVAGSGHRELLVATALLVVLGAAWLVSLGGLSMALGAFLAGLLLSGTEYRHQVEADLNPFRGLLLGLFFIYIGLAIDLAPVVEDWPIILGGTCLLLVGKAGLIMGLCLASRQPFDVALRASFHLAQGGEFAFVLFAVAQGSGALSHENHAEAVSIVVLSMALTPLLAEISRRLADRLARQQAHRQSGGLAEVGAEASDHVLIAGFGRVGQTVARLLAEQGIRYLALDLDPARVSICRSRDLSVYYGDASRAEILAFAGAGHARAAVITLDNAASASRAVAALRQRFPTLPIIARARDLKHQAALVSAGASTAVPETIAGSLELGSNVLTSLGVEMGEVAKRLEELREANYRGLEEIVAAPQQDDGKRRR